MKQLRDDFDNLRAVLDLVRKREEIYRIYVRLEVESFEQRLYDATDTTGTKRLPNYDAIMKLHHTLDNLPRHFDVHLGGRTFTRRRNVLAELPGSKRFSATGGTSGGAQGGSTPHVAGQNHGTPAPNFLQPLATRQSYVSSWQGAIPHAIARDSQEDSKMSPPAFRHRPRVGRGGRICIDRVPQSEPPSNIQPKRVYKAGIPLPRSLTQQPRLLDLLPKPIDEATLARKIEMAALSVMNDDDRTVSDVDDNDAVVVRLEKWLDTDEQTWGEERHYLGPL